MGLRNFLKGNPEPPVSDALEAEAREALPAIEALKGSKGWELMRAWCVARVNASISEWTSGIPHERQLLLSSRVATLGWVLDLLDEKQKVYRSVLGSVGALDNPGEDEGTTPFTDPHEQIEEI